MQRFVRAEAAMRLEKIRRLLKRQNHTVSQVAEAMNISADLATHYVRHLFKLSEIKVVSTINIKSGTPAKVYGWAINPVVVKHNSKKANLTEPPRKGVQTLTRWIGGNPFERLTASGA